MSARSLMIMGTRSSAGKSILVTALCRIFARRGYRVAPFKAQNFALNAGVTPEGLEMARSTIAQAEAAGIEPSVDMNPALIKSEGDRGSQLVLDGRVWGRIDHSNWQRLKPMLRERYTAAYDRLQATYELVILEGAGSPAEINLKDGDLVNMAMALYAHAPVLLVGDIDQGGVFAALAGTLMLLEARERALVKGFVINKFRGDPGLLGDGLEMLRERAWDTPTLGVIPFLPEIGVAAEDAEALEGERPARLGSRAPMIGAPVIDVVVIRLPHIANFDDFDPLAAEPGVEVRYVDLADDLGRPSAVILPGTKLTIDDLAWLRRRGLVDVVQRLADDGTPVVGICGGYQILGQTLRDPDGIETQGGVEVEGLALLALETTFAGDKRTTRTRATLKASTGPFAALAGQGIKAYEIHMGRSRFTAPGVAALCRVESEAGSEAHDDGAVAANGAVWGTYLHGIFDNDTLRHAWLASLGWEGGRTAFDRQAAYDRLADHVEAHLDVAAVERIILAG